MHRFCPVCNTRYDEGETFCARDGAELMAAGHAHAGNLVGTTIADRYDVIAQIATGGMGVVYKARQKLLDRYVALKVLPRELANDPDTERRFFNEARAISQLRHPHIVTLFDFGRTADRKLFIAMEYVHGEPLAVHIENRPLPVTSAVRIADQVLDALAEAHRAGIVHRDIKPDNVMLEVRSGQLFVRLLDFGIAKSDVDTARLTKTGIVFGTPEYISPEQVLGKPIDLRADLYGVGLLLFEMLSGHRPFGGSGTAIAYKHGHDPVPSLLERYPDLEVPVALDALIYRLMAKDPAARPRSADAVRRLLLEAALGADLSFESGPLPPLQLDFFGDGADPLGPLEPPILDRGGAPTVSSRPPPGVPPPLLAPPDEIEPGPPPIGRPSGEHPSIDRALGPRPPRPSALAAPTIQAPAELFQRRPASRRPLVLGALLAVIGLGSLLATAWIERPFAPQPVAPRPVPAEAPRPAPPTVPDSPPTYTAEVLTALAGPLRPRPIPRALKAEADLAVLPADEADPPPEPAARRQQISAARNALAALPEGDPARLDLLERIGDLEWAAANAAYAAELTRFQDDSAAFVEGAREAAPAQPVPAYGDAVIAYERLVEAAPEREGPRVLARLGHGLVAAGRVEAGMMRLARLVAEHPDSPDAPRARLALADRAFARGEAEAALAHYTALAERGTPRMRRYAEFQLGYVHAALGAHEAAVDAFHRLLEALRHDAELGPHYRPQALDALTLTYAHLPGGRRQAISYFRGLGGEALARRQSRLLAMAYAARGQAEEAAAAWRAALDDAERPVHGPGERAELLTRLAEQEAAAGRVEAALSVIDGPLGGCAPLGETPAATDCRLTRANALLVGHRVDEAVALLEPIAARLPLPDDPDAAHVAEARFRLAETGFVRFTEAAPPAVELDAAVEALDAAFRRAAEPGVDRWRVAADCRLGQLHERYADLLRARAPAGVDPDLDARIEAARAQAMAHFAAAEGRAREARIETRWARAAAERLQAMRRVADER